jgi:ferric-dicitrate binding protein FerR (iron transport regulator)
MYSRMPGQSFDPDFAADRFWAQLDRYLAGEASPDDRAAVEQWVVNDPANAVRARDVAGEASASPSVPPRSPQEGDRAAMLSALRDARLHRDPRMPAVDVVRMWRDAQQRTNVAGGHSIARDVAAESKRLVAARRSMGANRFTPSLRRWGIAVGVGAAVVSMIVLGRGHRASSPSPGLSGRAYATAIGQRAVIQLSDGSRITLAPQSTLTVENTFGRDTRSVSLVGEAYFEAASAPSTPFIVRTAGVSTTVLGTSFDVMRYADDSTTRVTVVSGKVASVAPHHPRVTLIAGMMARVGDSTVVTTMAGDLTPYTGWTHDELEFDKVPTADVLATLERWYGVRFQLTDSSLASVRLSGAFDYKSRESMLHTLSTLLDATVSVEGTGNAAIITIRPHRTDAGSARAKVRTGSVFTSHSEVGR